MCIHLNVHSTGSLRHKNVFRVEKLFQGQSKPSTMTKHNDFTNTQNSKKYIFSSEMVLLISICGGSLAMTHCERYP